MFLGQGLVDAPHPTPHHPHLPTPRLFFLWDTGDRAPLHTHATPPFTLPLPHPPHSPAHTHTHPTPGCGGLPRVTAGVVDVPTAFTLTRLYDFLRPPPLPNPTSHPYTPSRIAKHHTPHLCRSSHDPPLHSCPHPLPAMTILTCPPPHFIATLPHPHTPPRGRYAPFHCLCAMPEAVEGPSCHLRAGGTLGCVCYRHRDVCERGTPGRRRWWRPPLPHPPTLFRAEVGPHTPPARTTPAHYPMPASAPFWTSQRAFAPEPPGSRDCLVPLVGRLPRDITLPPFPPSLLPGYPHTCHYPPLPHTTYIPHTPFPCTPTPHPHYPLFYLLLMTLFCLTFICICSWTFVPTPHPICPTPPPSRPTQDNCWTSGCCSSQLHWWAILCTVLIRRLPLPGPPPPQPAHSPIVHHPPTPPHHYLTPYLPPSPTPPHHLAACYPAHILFKYLVPVTYLTCLMEGGVVLGRSLYLPHTFPIIYSLLYLLLLTPTIPLLPTHLDLTCPWV